MFQKILIANRGEIACRIIKTAKKLGIQTVAIYSDVDQAALFVSSADEAYRIGTPQSQDSYLNIKKIITIAKKAQVQAIHPGYGFLSENAAFAKRCEEENICFIGPSASAITTMGSKSEAKKILSKTSVPLIPGYHGDEQSPDFLLRQAKQIGFPILIKAAAGGGGKGMRIVQSESSFMTALASCQREAQSSFSNAHVLLEKYFQSPRHVEVQIFADMHGNYVHLFERDCSIQRRHQKMIEEAPAPNIDEETRTAIGSAAIDVAKSINYVGAGTIEFLMDAQQNFYFMEMNTRLQVEHPITEMITGIDLVEWQFRIATGEVLPLKQTAITQKGHAIEVRIYAEDPENNFMPSTGKIIYLKEPIQNGVRVDTGIAQGDHISPYYDPMLAKLIVWSTSREESIMLLHQALAAYHIAGVKNNINYLHTITSHNAFVNANLSTNFIKDNPLTIQPAIDKSMSLGLSALGLLAHESTEKTQNSLWQLFANFRINLPCRRDFYFKDDDSESTKVTCLLKKKLIVLTCRDTTYYCSNLKKEDHQITVSMNDESFTFNFILDKENIYLFSSSFTAMNTIIDPSDNMIEDDEIKGHLTAPMPASITQISVKKGDNILAGDTVMILEAMKMEHTITAPFTGTVSDVYFTTGDIVQEGMELAIIEPE